jgi:polyferredoxin
MTSASLFTIEQSKCERDHICVHICPFGIVGTDPDGYPTPNRWMESACMNCGHCMAAIDACKPVEEALQLPAGHKACGALMLGYPRLRYHLVPQRKPAGIAWRG